MMNRSRKRSIVYAVRDFPLGCGTHPQRSFKTPTTCDVLVAVKIPSIDHDLVAAPKQEPESKKSDPHVLAALPQPKGTCLRQEPGFKRSVHDCDDVSAPTRKRTCLRQEPSFRNSLHDRVLTAPKFKEAAFRSSHQHVLAGPPKPQGTRLKQEPEVKNSVRDHTIAAPTPQRTCLKQEPAYTNSQQDRVLAAPKLKGACSKQEEALRGSDQHDPTSREQVLEVLHHFREVFKQLDRDKQARRLDGDLFDATARIDIRTLAVLEKMGKQVNTEKRIGLVPGVNVGDEFQYKTELRLVGLHFKTMCGIDYMNVGDVKLATSIVASEGYGYSDTFGAGVVVYTGEGGNVVSKEKKTEDQRLVKGNLALANSMRKRSLVRVIRGEERLDKKGKRYVYDGLYLVDKYWLEKEVRGTTVYKFKLCKVPGQSLC
ncbi:unnamed protein product [Eruca vesicaria subsp. sativa]|uniref:YDG domain-containing protein n=1 Tax=Eruca vesicaria subsp. sativa TaxID=29727 RepID=A0ABC8J937_ERUVS|nr:unnamed protein product [Eruca vesicaria subsp. sativa]